jgi:hypothetical protein
MDNKIVVIAHYIVVKCKNHTVATPMSLYKQTMNMSHGTINWL